MAVSRTHHEERTGVWMTLRDHDSPSQPTQAERLVFSDPLKHSRLRRYKTWLCGGHVVTAYHPIVAPLASQDDIMQFVAFVLILANDALRRPSAWQSDALSPDKDSCNCTSLK
jgi:hypothetical protein